MYNDKWKFCTVRVKKQVQHVCILRFVGGFAFLRKLLSLQVEMLL